VAQGIGGAMMVPVGRLVVLHSTQKAALINAIAHLTWPALTAPVLGGLIATYASWRWIFLINLPLGPVGFVVSLNSVPPSARPSGRGSTGADLFLPRSASPPQGAEFP
jgi:predicted MFS family arabinose efflux permease